VLCRARDRETLRRDLVEMRARMAREHGEGRSGAEQAKQRRGGLIDIEFIIQFGVLDQASAHPETLRSTALLEQLASLVDCGWIGRDQAAVLDRAARGLRRARMLEALAALDAPVAGDDDAVCAVFESRLGRSAEQA
jgi:glutamate-ammonia-ligase adenylyltransferase